MIIKIDKSGSMSGLTKTLNNVLQNAGVQGIMILAGDANNFNAQEIHSIVTSLSVPIFGGIFPQIIVEEESLTRGTIVVGFTQKINIQIIPNISDSLNDFDCFIEKNIGTSITNAKTMFVFVDGFSKRISALIESLFNVFGLDLNYIGGGAGSLDMIQKPCLFTNEGLLKDSAVLALIDISSGIGVSHGWEVISGPYKVTEAVNNSIISLDWEPAFDTYKNVIEQESDYKFSEHEFVDIAKAYPFGIGRVEAEMIVRDPFVVGNDKSLICVGEVPEGCFVHILTGNKDSLIHAASHALELSIESYTGPTEETVTFFVDCISRYLFMGDDFKEELDIVHSNRRPLIGILTIGEIANSGKNYLEFYNKTAVVSILEA
jgi:hypothetical protein